MFGNNGWITQRRRTTGALWSKLPVFGNPRISNAGFQKLEQGYQPQFKPDQVTGLYLDGDNGDDTNDGSSLANAVQTPEKAQQLCRRVYASRITVNTAVSTNPYELNGLDGLNNVRFKSIEEDVETRNVLSVSIVDQEIGVVFTVDGPTLTNDEWANKMLHVRGVLGNAVNIAVAGNVGNLIYGATHNRNFFSDEQVSPAGGTVTLLDLANFEINGFIAASSCTDLNFENVIISGNSLFVNEGAKLQILRSITTCRQLVAGLGGSSLFVLSSIVANLGNNNNGMLAAKNGGLLTLGYGNVYSSLNADDVVNARIVTDLGSRIRFQGGAIHRGFRGYDLEKSTAQEDFDITSTLAMVFENQISGSPSSTKGIIANGGEYTFPKMVGEISGDYLVEGQNNARVGLASTTSVDTATVTNAVSANGGVSATAKADDGTVITNGSPKSPFVEVFSASDFPDAVSGVITLEANTVYKIFTEIDLQGDRLVFADNTSLVGETPEVCRIKSTGLTSTTALITSEWTLALNNIALEHATILDLDATANANQTIDWYGVNFVNATSAVGTIKNYDNIICNLIGFLNSGGLTFDGTLATIAFTDTLFENATGLTSITIPSTATITRRIRIDKSAFVSLSGETALDISTSATIPDEAYILQNCNFSGGGTYLAGIASTDNKSRFEDNRGIENSGNIAEYYMNGNATATTIAVAGTYVKVAGATTAGAFVEKFDVTTTNNRAVYTGALIGFYKVTVVASVAGTSGQVIALRIAKNGSPTVSSTSRATMNAGGRAENVVCQDVVQLENTDYIELWATNESGTSPLTVEDLNVIIERLN